jgi:L-lactate permease
MNLEFNKDIIKYIVYTISIFLAIDYYINNKFLPLIFFIILSCIIYYYNNSIVIALTLSIIISNLISLQIIEGNTSQGIQNKLTDETNQQNDAEKITLEQEEINKKSEKDINSLPKNELIIL